MRSFLMIHDVKTAVAPDPCDRAACGGAELASGRLASGERRGRLWRVPLDRPALLPLDTGAAVRCNNDHGLRRTGGTIFFSSHTGRGPRSMPCRFAGGAPTPVTTHAPSWWHGVTSDGRTIVLRGRAEQKTGVDIWCLPLRRGRGAATDLRRGPFRTDRTRRPMALGLVQLRPDRAMRNWRVRPDGTGHEQVFEDARVNWFPHPSPDGRHLLYLPTRRGPRAIRAKSDVALVLADADGGNRRVAVELFGGRAR